MTTPALRFIKGSFRHRASGQGMVRRWIALGLLLVGLCGCSHHLNQADGWHDAPIDRQSGKVVMLWLMYPDDTYHPDKVKPHLLENDYAMLILWGYGEKDHELYLFDGKKRRYFYTEDLECFLRTLRQLPTGVVVEWVRKCAAQFHWKMPDEDREKVLQVLRERKTAQPDFQSTVCVCEAIGWQLPEAERVLTRQKTE